MSTGKSVMFPVTSKRHVLHVQPIDIYLYKFNISHVSCCKIILHVDSNMQHVRLAHPQGHKQTVKTRGQVSEGEGDMLPMVLICNQITNNVTYFNANSGFLLKSRFRTLPDAWQHSQETNIHGPGGIPTDNPSKVVIVDPRARPSGHRDPVNLYRIYHHQVLKISFSACNWADSCNLQS
jgi:hypothetical protein